MAFRLPGKSSYVDIGDDTKEGSTKQPPQKSGKTKQKKEKTKKSKKSASVDPPPQSEANSQKSRDGHLCSSFTDSTHGNDENAPRPGALSLDHFLSGPHPPAQPPLPRYFDNRDSLYTEVANQTPTLSIHNDVYSSLDNSNSRSSDHHRSYSASPRSTRTGDSEFNNQISSFSTITSRSESMGSPERSRGSGQFPEWNCVEIHGKERHTISDGVEVSTFPSVPTHRKTSSYGENFGTFSVNNETISQGKRNTWRKHSLDEKMPKTVGHLYQTSERSQNETCSLNDESLTYEYPPVENNEDGNPSPQVLAEFIGNGGGTGIFKVPIRAAIHPGRPPSFELRPHPLRETQLGCFLRTITHVQGLIWAGKESGVRFWNLADVFINEKPGTVVNGDEETVPFCDSAKTSPTLCMLADSANRLIWTGHKDGKVRSWKMYLEDSDERPFKEVVAWQAHRNPIMSLAMSSYSDLWSGSEGGSVKVWPWEAIAKALDTMEEERHIAVLGVERSYIDLRNQATLDGVCHLPAGDVKFMLADTSRGKVWGGGHLQFALWDARTRELLKVFGLDGQPEPLPDFSAPQDVVLEDEMKAKFVSSNKKEKNQTSLTFFQRSRNALMGAADAVRRAAAKTPFVDDIRRTEAIIMSPDGMIWTGCANGSLVQWDGNANRLQDFHHHSFSVESMCAAGTRIWVGYESGILQVLNLEGKLLGEWVAHSSAISKITLGGGYVFTMANHGGIHAWNMASPNPIDNIMRSELSSKEFLYYKQESLKLVVGTWNVGQGKASHDSLISWLGSVASDAGVIIVGLQEVEMGAGFLAMAAAKESVGLEGSSNGQWWLDTIGKVLGEGKFFERVGSRQLAGLFIAVWIRKYLRPYIGDVDASAVPCGFGRAIGNKGAVGLKMRVYKRAVCFVNCHFAAHLEAVNKRNADFDHVYRTMVFSRPTTGVNAAAAGVSSSAHLPRGVNVMGFPHEERPDLAEADMLIFLGDFNYRLYGISYDEARDFVSQRCFDWLRDRDQLRAEMRAGRVFQGMREAISKFPPTYKFERHQAGLQGYDSGEKKRIPARCDRILFRDNRPTSESRCSLECPVVSTVSRYEACMDVTDSDHKPVRCLFNLEIAHVDEWIRRVEFGSIMFSNEKIQSLLNDLNVVPETVVSTNNIILQDLETSVLRITNRCVKNKATFRVICKEQSTVKDDGFVTERHSRGDYGFPRWLEVNPAVGMLRPGQVMEVSVQHKEIYTPEELVDGVAPNWWSEDTIDHEVVLEIIVGGSYCFGTTNNHEIHVRHSFTVKPLRLESRGSSRRQSNYQQRPEHQNGQEQEDFSYDFRSFQCL